MEHCRRKSDKDVMELERSGSTTVNTTEALFRSFEEKRISSSARRLESKTVISLLKKRKS